jgi:hypothetical protein
VPPSILPSARVPSASEAGITAWKCLAGEKAASPLGLVAVVTWGDAKFGGDFKH